jgi:prophage antirepressor-like protein
MSIQLFNFPVTGQNVRVEGDSENPWFCLVDICEILGLTNPSKVASDQLKPDGLTLSYVIDSLGRQQNTTFINESNLYRCILRSRKPQAEAFQDWIVEEVLPSIRKTGSYTVGNKPVDEPGRNMMESIRQAISEAGQCRKDGLIEYAETLERLYNLPTPTKPSIPVSEPEKDMIEWMIRCTKESEGIVTVREMQHRRFQGKKLKSAIIRDLMTKIDQAGLGRYDKKTSTLTVF